MAEAITSATVAGAAGRVAETLILHKVEFNKLDGVGGDGDMGTTLSVVSQAILEDATPSVEDVGGVFMRLAKVIARTSGSSLSAVIMTGLMAAAQRLSGRAELPWEEFSSLISDVLIVMRQRSKAKAGDKTILDAIEAVAKATHDCQDANSFAIAAQGAATAALVDFRDKPAMIGRLRLEANSGIGHDDPGMYALSVAISAMVGGSAKPISP